MRAFLFAMFLWSVRVYGLSVHVYAFLLRGVLNFSLKINDLHANYTSPNQSSVRPYAPSTFV